ncbi:MAG: hypothetical protein ACR2KL_04390 [Nocardioidaceae bacterium]
MSVADCVAVALWVLVAVLAGADAVNDAGVAPWMVLAAIIAGVVTTYSTASAATRTIVNEIRDAQIERLRK